MVIKIGEYNYLTGNDNELIFYPVGYGITSFKLKEVKGKFRG